MAKNNSDELDKLILRMSECETVINDLDNSPLWKIVMRDTQEESQQLDDNWQAIWDEKKLMAARVLKFACKHLVDLKYKYTEELKDIKKTLFILQNPDKEIRKDYDGE